MLRFLVRTAVRTAARTAVRAAVISHADNQEREGGSRGATARGRSLLASALSAGGRDLRLSRRPRGIFACYPRFSFARGASARAERTRHRRLGRYLRCADLDSLSPRSGQRPRGERDGRGSADRAALRGQSHRRGPGDRAGARRSDPGATSSRRARPHAMRFGSPIPSARTAEELDGAGARRRGHRHHRALPQAHPSIGCTRRCSTRSPTLRQAMENPGIEPPAPQVWPASTFLEPESPHGAPARAATAAVPDRAGGGVALHA